MGNEKRGRHSAKASRPGIDPAKAKSKTKPPCEGGALPLCHHKTPVGTESVPCAMTSDVGYEHGIELNYFN